MVGLPPSTLLSRSIPLVLVGLISLGISPSPRMVERIRYWSNPHYSRVVIDVSGEVAYQYHKLKGPPRIYIDVLGARMRSQLKSQIPIAIEKGPVRRVRVAQNRPSVVRVVLDLDYIPDFKVFKLYHPYRIVVDVFGRSASPGKYPSFPPTVKKIVIDPGHGGKDPGAIGPGGLKEKDLTLDIALRLARLIKLTTPYRVVLTRDRDVFLPLEERTAIANRENADLFISIHINASKRSNMKGIETYLLDFTSDREAISLAARENLVPRNRMDELRIILQDLMLTSKIKESFTLARTIQTSLVKYLKDRYRGIIDLGVKRGPFYVLFGAQMPSILVELFFLSNDQDRAHLLDTSYRERIAQALLAGINHYSWGTLPQ